MSKRTRKISMALVAFLLTLLTIVSFAEPPEAPNQLITENPYKEVKTVEADKNREHAEMNITVNKINQKSVDGFSWETGEILLYLPKEPTKAIDNNIYYITDSIDNFPDISTVNGKKYFSNFNKFVNKSLDSAQGINIDKKEDFALIKTKTNEQLYLGLLDQSTGEIKNVWNIEVKKATDTISIEDAVIDKENKTLTIDTDVVFKKTGVKLTDESLVYINESTGPGQSFTKVKITKDIKKDYRFENNKLIYEYKGNELGGVEFYSFDTEKRALSKLSYGVRLNEFYTEKVDMTNISRSHNIFVYGSHTGFKRDVHKSDYNYYETYDWFNITGWFEGDKVVEITPDLDLELKGIFGTIVNKTSRKIDPIWMRIRSHSGFGIYYHNSIEIWSNGKIENESYDLTYILPNDSVQGENVYECNASEEIVIKDGSTELYRGTFGDLKTGVKLDVTGAELKLDSANKLTAIRRKKKAFNKEIVLSVADKRNVYIKLKNSAWIQSFSKSTEIDLTKLGLNETGGFSANMLVSEFPSKEGMLEIYIDGKYVEGMYFNGKLEEIIDVDKYLGYGLKLKYKVDGGMRRLWIVKTRETYIDIGERLETRVTISPENEGSSDPTKPVGNLKRVLSIKNEGIKKRPAWTKTYIYPTVELEKGSDGVVLKFGEYARSNRTTAHDTTSFTTEDYGLHFALQPITNELGTEGIYSFISGARSTIDLTKKLLPEVIYEGTPPFRSKDVMTESFKITPNITHEDLYEGAGFKGRGLGLYSKIKLTAEEYNEIFRLNAKYMKLTNEVKHTVSLLNSQGPTSREEVLLEPSANISLPEFRHKAEIVDLSKVKKVISEETYTVNSSDAIKVYDGEKLLLETTGSSITGNSQVIEEAGMGIKFDSASNKFEFVKLKAIDYEKELRIEILNSSNLLETIMIVKLKNIKLRTKSEITFDSSNFNYLRGDQGYPYGRIRVYPTSESQFHANVGIIDANDTIVTDDRKNGQFKQSIISGETYPLKSEHLGKTIHITVNGTRKTINLKTEESNLNPMGTAYFTLSGITIGVDFQSISVSKGGIDFILREWDGTSKKIDVEVEFPDGAETNYIINIPEFEGKNYVNDELPLANEYFSTGKYLKEINEFIDGELDKIVLGIKDYDLSVLGKNGMGGSNLRIKIPRAITLIGSDSEGNTQNIDIVLRLDSMQNGSPSVDGNYYIISPTNDGYKDRVSAMRFELILTGALRNNLRLKNIVSLKGTNLNLVSIGVENASTSSINKMTTLIDEVEYKINFNIGSEVIDFRDEDKGTKINGETIFEVLNTNKIRVIENDVEVLTDSITNLKAGIEIPKTGVKIKYNPFNRNLVFEKTGFIDYTSNNLKLELRSSSNLLLKTIYIDLKNKLGFEILPGKGKLDFGDFFPGDIKKAESLIEFKNPNEAKIIIELNSSNDHNMYKIGSAPTVRTTIPLTNMEVRDLKTGVNKTNTFKISGTATTSKEMEVGDYRGNVDVIITIIP